MNVKHLYENASQRTSVLKSYSHSLERIRPQPLVDAGIDQAFQAFTHPEYFTFS
ncbi:MAG: hypothetical protein QGM45_10700 [Anaerolineales bacterium]|nr:hypothetical protein [Anaerolineales bacterium]